MLSPGQKLTSVWCIVMGYAVPPLFIPDQKLPKSDQKQTKFSSKSDLNQTNFDLFPDQIQDNRFKTGVLVIRQRRRGDRHLKALC